MARLSFCPSSLQPALYRQNVRPLVVQRGGRVHPPPRGDQAGTDVDLAMVEHRLAALDEDVGAPEGLGGGHDVAVVEVPHGLRDVLCDPHHFVQREAVFSQVQVSVEGVSFSNKSWKITTTRDQF